MFLFVYSFQVKYHRLLQISIHSCTCASFFIFSQRLLYKSLSFLKWFHEAISLWWLFMGSVTLWWWLKLLLQILFLFFNSFKLIWEREKEREKHRFVVSPIYAFTGLFSYVPWQGIQPSMLAHRDDASTNWPIWPGLKLFYGINFPTLAVHFIRRNQTISRPIKPNKQQTVISLKE